MRFSLIVATKGRTTELGVFFNSLLSQNTQALELIVIDQNEDDRLDDILKSYEQHFPITHIRSSIANSSHARNLGITIATGDILAFPDDDCTYPPGILAHVKARFAASPQLGLLTGPSRAPDGKLGSGRWTTHSCIPNYANVWTSVIEFNMFIRCSVLPMKPYFDESLGVGARFGSGEGVDLVIRLIEAGVQHYYDFDMYVTHPDKTLTPLAVARAFTYGSGFGRVLRKHFPLIKKHVILRFFIRPLGGIMLSIMRGNLLYMRYYAETIRGRLSGFLTDAST